MKIKDLKINFRYLGGNIACLSVDSIMVNQFIMISIMKKQ